MALLPKKVSHGEQLKASWLNQLLDYVRAITPKSGVGTMIQETPGGTIISAPKKKGEIASSENSKLIPIEITADRGYNAILKKHCYVGFYYPDYDGATLGFGNPAFLLPLATLTTAEKEYEDLHPGTSSVFPFNPPLSNGTNEQDFPNATLKDLPMRDPLQPEQESGFRIHLTGPFLYESYDMYIPAYKRFAYLEGNVKVGFEDHGTTVTVIYEYQATFDWLLPINGGKVYSVKTNGGSTSKINGPSTVQVTETTVRTKLDGSHYLSSSTHTLAVILYNSTTRYIDSDGDGVPNWREYQDGTDANNAADYDRDYTASNPSKSYTSNNTPEPTNSPTDIGDEFLFGFFVTPQNLAYEPVGRPYLTFDYPRWMKGSQMT